METKKNSKTLKQQYKSHNLKAKVLFGAKPLATMLPLAITMGVKSNEWFAQDWKVATGGTIAIIIMGLSALLVGKKTEDKTITNTWITLILGWYSVAFIFMLLGQIMTEIWWVMCVAGSGMLAGAGIDYAEQNEKLQAKKIKVALDKAGESILEEQAKEEMLKDQPKKQATE